MIILVWVRCMKTTILKLNYNGKGITRDDGVVTFVPGVLPEEEIEYKIIKKDKRFNIGKCTEIIKKSSNRITSKCPYFNVVVVFFKMFHMIIHLCIKKIFF